MKSEIINQKVKVQEIKYVTKTQSKEFFVSDDGKYKSLVKEKVEQYENEMFVKSCGDRDEIKIKFDSIKKFVPYSKDFWAGSRTYFCIEKENDLLFLLLVIYGTKNINSGRVFNDLSGYEKYKNYRGWLGLKLNVISHTHPFVELIDENDIKTYIQTEMKNIKEMESIIV